MPDIAWNLKTWNEVYDWEGRKPGWCYHTPENEIDWRMMLLPRIADFIPCRTILEIAPGHGRWTHFLRNFCEKLQVVDLAPNCIKACQTRFANETHIEYHLNDGLTLDFLSNNSIDFVFSFDSLVHVDADVLDSYLSQLSQKFTKDGVGFFHHSNSAALLNGQAPELVKIKGGRSTYVSAEIFEALCAKHKLCCISQEIINWNSAELIDCLSIFCRSGSIWQRNNHVFSNPEFRNQRALLKTIVRPYTFEFPTDRPIDSGQQQD